tara:strand:+ start:432 stop:704 length:273 start_codon:yes stop_codon:yes gene_type:complete
MKKMWTDQELLLVAVLYRAGHNYHVIAEKMGRTRGSVAHALHFYRPVLDIGFRAKGAGAPKKKPETPVPKKAIIPKPKRNWWQRIADRFF